MIGVTPVFVLDGKPPELKKDVLNKRKQARYKQKETKSNGTRSRLKYLLRQCKSMLEMMGLECLESDGEGEALCGQLNRDGVGIKLKNFNLTILILDLISDCGWCYNI